MNYLGNKSYFKDILQNYVKLLPENKIYDLFAGSMSLSIIMNELYPNNKIIINDNNKLLMVFYGCLRNNKKDLIYNINMLNKIEIINNYKVLIKIINNNDENIFKKSAAYYISNKIAFKGKIYFTKTGNISFVGKKRTKILNININDFNKFSVLLNNVELHNKDIFDSIYHWLDHIQPGDLFILDPPYDSLNKCFINYGSDFNKYYHEKLFNFIIKINEKKGKIITFNNNTAFIRYLYRDYNIDIFKFKSKINGKNIEELLIYN